MAAVIEWIDDPNTARSQSRPFTLSNWQVSAAVGLADGLSLTALQSWPSLWVLNFGGSGATQYPGIARIA